MRLVTAAARALHLVASMRLVIAAGLMCFVILLAKGTDAVRRPGECDTPLACSDGAILLCTCLHSEPCVLCVLCVVQHCLVGNFGGNVGPEEIPCSSPQNCSNVAPHCPTAPLKHFLKAQPRVSTSKLYTNMPLSCFAEWLLAATHACTHVEAGVCYRWGVHRACDTCMCMLEADNMHMSWHAQARDGTNCFFLRVHACYC